MLSICFMFFLLLVCGFDCLFLDAIAIAWFFGCRFVLSFLCQLLVGFVAKGRKRLKKRLSVDPNCRDLDVVVFLEVNTSRNMRLLEQPGGQLERSPETV